MSNQSAVSINLSDIQLSDIQGNILREYETECATYLFFRVDTATEARRWLAALHPQVTRATWSRETNGDAMLNVAITFQGLRSLGVSPTFLGHFPEEFRDGMAKRASILGDFGHSAPERWEPPFGSSQIHVLVIVHGVNRAACDAKAGWIEDQARQTGGVTRIFMQEAATLPNNKEHFGFRDGISQPWIAVNNLPVPPEVSSGGGTWTEQGTWKPLKLGEFLLGYEDESGFIAKSALPPELETNGTYLVLRKLKKDVPAFQKSVAEAAAQIFDGDPQLAQDRLAALMMGRWPSGCPVSLSPEKDDPGLAGDPSQVNDFTYQDDQLGLKCPLGAHVRRTNLRDLPDASGTNRHRIIRRGLSYEEPANSGDPADTQERGTIFIALNADIHRQFEFLQRHWISNGEFLGLDRTDRDPFIGSNRDERDLPPKDQPGQSHPETPRKFTVPAATKMPWAFNLLDFVTTRGGDYFFLPSLTALNGLATGRFTSFLTEYENLPHRIADPVRLAGAQMALVMSGLRDRPREMLDELLKLPSIFQFQGLPPAGIPPITIATKYQDVTEILKHHQVFSVRKYGEKMAPPRGPFILGMGDGPVYQRELSIFHEVFKSSDLDTIVLPLLQKTLDRIMQHVRPRGFLDVIESIAWPVPLKIVRDYFGVPGPDELTLKQWMRDIYKDIFLNLPGFPEWTQKADVAVTEINHYLSKRMVDLISSRPQGMDTVLTRLTDRLTDPSSPVDADFVCRNMLGLTVGVVETSLKAVARTIDQFLRRPQALHTARDAAVEGDRPTVRRCALEAMRFNPQNHVLYRWCEEETTIAAGTERATSIPKDGLVFAATLSAMSDPDVFPDPDTFDPSRPHQKYLFFGYSLHECLGRHIAELLLEEVMLRILPLRKLRRSMKDQFDPLDLLPEHLLLEFDPEEQ